MTYTFIKKVTLGLCVFILSGALYVGSSANSFAQDNKKEVTKETEEENPAEEEDTSTPISEWIDAENALIKDLSAQDQETFFIIRNKHSVIRSMRVVRDDISNAVKACSEENPEIKEEITGRFSDWKNAVEPILKEADKFLKTEIRSQKVVPNKDFRNILKLNDAAYAFSNGQIEKRPVTDMKACEKLLKSMDRTENKLIALLQNILLPEEVMRERLEQQKKREAGDKKEG